MSSEADLSLPTPKRVATPVEGLKKFSDSPLAKSAASLDSDPLEATRKEAYSRLAVAANVSEIGQGVPLVKKANLVPLQDNVVTTAGSQKSFDTAKEIVNAKAYQAVVEGVSGSDFAKTAMPEVLPEIQQGVPLAKVNDLRVRADNVVAVDGGPKNFDTKKDLGTPLADIPRTAPLPQGQAVFKSGSMADDAGKSTVVHEGKPLFLDTKDVAASQPDFAKTVQSETFNKKASPQAIEQGIQEVIPLAKSSEFPSNRENMVAVGSQKNGDARKDLGLTPLDSQPAGGNKAIAEDISVNEAKPILQGRPAAIDGQSFAKSEDIAKGEPILQGEPVFKSEAVPSSEAANRGEPVSHGQLVDQAAVVRASKPVIADSQSTLFKDGSLSGNRPEQFADVIFHPDKRLDAGMAASQLSMKESADGGRAREIASVNGPSSESSILSERTASGDKRLADMAPDNKSPFLLDHAESATVKTAAKQSHTEPNLPGERKLAEADPAPSSRRGSKTTAYEVQVLDRKTELEALAQTDSMANSQITALAENRRQSGSDANGESRIFAGETGAVSPSMKAKEEKAPAENGPSQTAMLPKSDKAEQTSSLALRPLPNIELLAKIDRPLVVESATAYRKKRDTESGDEFRRYPVGPGATVVSAETGKAVVPNLPYQLKGAVARDIVEGNVTSLPKAATPLMGLPAPGLTGKSALPIAGLNFTSPPKGALDTPHSQSLVNQIAQLTNLTNRPMTPQSPSEAGVRAPLPASVAVAFGPLGKRPDGKPVTHELIGTEVAVAAIIAAAAIAKARPGEGKLTVQPNASIMQPDARRPDPASNRVTDPSKWSEPGRDTHVVGDGKKEPALINPSRIFGDKRELIGTELVVTAMIAAAAISKARTDGRAPGNQNTPHVEHSTITVTECGARRPAKTAKADETLAPRPLKPVDKEEPQQVDLMTGRLAPDKADSGIVHRGKGDEVKGPQPAQALHIVQDRAPVIVDEVKKTKAVKFELPELRITDDSFSRDLLPPGEEQPEPGMEGTTKGSTAQTAATQVMGKLLTRPTCLMDKNKTLTELAEELYHDETIAWLIADLNAGRIKETIIDGRRVVELTSRQQIELPVWEDIVEFRRNRPASAVTYNLITVVTESWIDRELLNSTLKFVGQTQKPHNLVAAFL